MLEAEKETKKLKTKLDTCMDKMDNCFDMFSTICKQKQEAAKAQEEAAKAQEEAAKAQREVFTHSGSVLKAIANVNREIADTASMSSMSPDTRERYMKSLHNRRNRLVDILCDLEEKEVHET
jgi:hypothetical protein